MAGAVRGAVTGRIMTGDTIIIMETVSPARGLAMLTPIAEQLNAILVIVVGGGMEYARLGTTGITEFSHVESVSLDMSNGFSHTY